MFTIHNLQYQGVFGIREVQDVLGLGDSLWTDDKLECYGCANFMKAALVYSDIITTVSPSYAEEIQTAYYGERLDGLLRARKHEVFGVLNGIDMADYNPATDARIPAEYTADDLSGKAKCKAELQEKLGLTVDPNVPIIGMGGISTWEDAVEMMIAGAAAVQVGTASFHDPYACIHIIEGMEEFAQRSGLHSITELTGTLQIEDAKLTPTVDEDGEARQLAVDVAVSAALQGRETVEREILQDAYAPTGTVTLEKETVTYPVTVGSGKNQFSLKERIHLEESEKPLLRAEEIWGEVRLSEARTATDAVEADGVLTVSLLYHCENDETPLCMLERGIPFGQMMELRGVAEGDAAAVQLRLDDLDFQMLSEQEGELRAAVTMEAVVLRDETAEIVKDITPEEEAAPSPMAGAVIYMVQPGDTLWKIAKRYRTTVEDILAINEIENPDLIYPGQKLLIIKQIH